MVASNAKCSDRKCNSFSIRRNTFCGPLLKRPRRCPSTLRSHPRHGGRAVGLYASACTSPLVTTISGAGLQFTPYVFLPFFLLPHAPPRASDLTTTRAANNACLRTRERVKNVAPRQSNFTEMSIVEPVHSPVLTRIEVCRSAPIRSISLFPPTVRLLKLGVCRRTHHFDTEGASLLKFSPDRPGRLCFTSARGNVAHFYP